MEPVALLTEELTVRLESLGKGCFKSLPQLTSVLMGRLYNALMQQPNLGADVEGYEEFMLTMQAILGSRG